MIPSDLSTLPTLRDCWVAIDPNGSRRHEPTPLRLALRSGGVVVDADMELAALCARLSEAGRTARTIVFAG